MCGGQQGDLSPIIENKGSSSILYTVQYYRTETISVKEKEHEMRITG